MVQPITTAQYDAIPSYSPIKHSHRRFRGDVCIAAVVSARLVVGHGHGHCGGQSKMMAFEGPRRIAGGVDGTSGVRASNLSTNTVQVGI